MTRIGVGAWVLLMGRVRTWAWPFLAAAAMALLPAMALPPATALAQDQPDAAPLPAIEVGTTVKGTIDVAGERDAYVLTIAPAEPRTLMDVRLIAPTGTERQVCLERPAPGQSATDPGTQLSCVRGQGGAAMRDLLLDPGTYHLVVTGEPSPATYALRLERTSAPVDDHETEPNDAPTSATRWPAGIVMRGWLVAQDVDHYLLRTSGEPQRWRIEAAGEGITGFQQVRMTGAQLAPSALDPETGRWTFPDVHLGPGEHLLRLDGAGGEYTLTATPLGPPDPDEELEPNDADPEPLPMGTARHGRLSERVDQDLYRFSLTAEERIRVRVEPPADAQLYVAISDSTQGVPVAEGQALGEPAVLDLVLPPDDYVIRVGAIRRSSERYRIELERGDPFEVEDAPALPAELELRLEVTDAAAFWPRAQALSASLAVTNTGPRPLSLTLDARTSDPRWAVTFDRPAMDVAAGATEVVPLTILVPADASRVPVRVTVEGRAPSGARRTAFTEVTPARDVPPTGERLGWSVPDALLGGIDLAAAALGGTPLPVLDAAGEAALHDGVAPTGGGLDVLASAPVELTVDLAGDEPLPVAGMILDPVAGAGGVAGAARDVELLLSVDGVTFQPVVAGVLSPAPFEQALVLPEPMEARFARLRIATTWGPPGRVRLGEWKVVGTPGVLPVEHPVDLAEPRLGGHIAWMDPQPSSVDLLDGVLGGDPSRPPNWLTADAGAERVTWIVAFRDGRAARVRSLGWQDPAASDPARRLRSVQVAISEDGPGGPWRDLGRWRLERDPDGSVAPFDLDGDPWVRAIRLRASIPERAGGIVELPSRLHAWERPPDDGYRSILGEWGDGVSDGPREWAGASSPLDAMPPDRGNHTRASALLLEAGDVAQGRVQRGTLEDWYTLTIPDGHRSLLLSLSGAPYLAASAELLVPDGSPVPLTVVPGTSARDLELSAAVEPGATYHLRVHQASLSAVVAFDTSASVDLSPVAQALDAYARDLTGDDEAVQLLPFASQPLLATWSRDRWEVAGGLRRLLPSGSSAMEVALIDAAKQLAAREGTRAILLLTDAESDTFHLHTQAWRALVATRAIVFPVHVNGPVFPLLDRRMMQDLAGLSGGRYAYAPNRSALDVAFDRMATWLRRPAVYGLSWTSAAEEPEPPAPGAVSVSVRPGPDGTAGAAPMDPSTVIGIVLDTSTSMRAELGRSTRIRTAQRVLTRLLREDLPPGIGVSLRWFHQARGSCETELAVPLGPLDPDAMAGIIEGIRIERSVGTPLAAAIEAMAGDLAAATGPRVVVVVSDGQESCGGDPEAAVRALRESGIDVTLNVVGIGLDGENRRRIRRLARIGGGAYFDVRRAGELEEALRAAVSAPFEVVDATGAVVARGSVGGPAVEVTPGVYRVVVRTDPEVVFQDVLVEPGSSPTLEVPGDA